MPPDDAIDAQSSSGLRADVEKLRELAEQLGEKIPILSRIIPVAPNQTARVVLRPAGDDQVTGNGVTAREYARLASAVYDPKYGDPSSYTAPPGWTLLRSIPNSKVGYASCEYVDARGNYVCAFRGTDGGDDVFVDIEQAAGVLTAQYDLVSETAHDLAWSFQNGWLFCDTARTMKATSLTFTGHSLGGGLAASAWTIAGYPTVTFNAAGLSLRQRFEDNVLVPLSDRVQPLDVQDGVCTNYHVYREALSTFQWALSHKMLVMLPPFLDVVAQAAGRQVMLQRPTNPLVTNPIELHKMANVRKALELPAYPDGVNDPY